MQTSEHDNCTFSVIIPVYNVASYLAGAIESILRQKGVDVGQDVQLILVDDGSTDGSAKVCEAYAKRYPHIITYIEQENAGVSAARNRGFKEARGTYVWFFDADDKAPPKALQSAREFYNRCAQDAVPLPPFVAMWLEFFGDRRGPHMLNYKFTNKDRIVDLKSEPEAVIVHVTSCICLREAIEHYSFDTRVAFSEDLLFLNTILLESGNRYGLLSKSVRYYYRRHANSAVGGLHNRRTYYIDTLEYVYKPLLELERQTTGNQTTTKSRTIRKFIQYVLMYDLQWRVKFYATKECNVLSPAEVEEYKKQVTGFLCKMDDDVILAQRSISAPLKFGILDVKHGTRAWRERLTINQDTEVLMSASPRSTLSASPNNTPGDVLGNALVYRLSDDEALEIQQIAVNRKTGRFEVEGVLSDYGFPGVSQGLLLGEVPLALEHLPQPESDVYVFDKKVWDAVGFKVEVPFSDSALLLRPFFAYACNNGGEGSESDGDKSDGASKQTTVLSTCAYGKASGLTGRNSRDYRLLGTSLVYADRRSMQFVPYGLGRVVKRELLFFIESVQGTGKTWLLNAAKKLILVESYRLVTLFRRHFNRLCRRKLWLFSGRPDSADGDTVAAYEYMRQQGSKGGKGTRVKLRYALPKTSLDYRRLKQAGFKLISYGSARHKLAFMAADRVISADADEEAFGLFGRRWALYCGVCDFDFVQVRPDLSPSSLLD
jgi:glycosyltransferase involved in cell wall biosynthesis